MNVYVFIKKIKENQIVLNDIIIHYYFFFYIKFKMRKNLIFYFTILYIKLLIYLQLF